MLADRQHRERLSGHASAREQHHRTSTLQASTAAAKSSHHSLCCSCSRSHVQPARGLIWQPGGCRKLNLLAKHAPLDKVLLVNELQPCDAVHQKACARRRVQQRGSWEPAGNRCISVLHWSERGLL